MSLYRMPPRSRRGSGWTLVELMMVVALIGVLSTVALPRYLDYRDRIRVETARKHIVIMSTAIMEYRQEHGEYPESLVAVGMFSMKDPWDRPYAYYNIEANGKGHARKDRALNPLNTDFDLYSVGRDGKTKGQISNRDSLDDVIRARDGGFIGLAADF
jgi:general secretion pathway protein G